MAKLNDGLIGLVVGDVMGLPLVGISREELLKEPIFDMTEGGIYNVEKGTWSLPTEMALLVEDIIDKDNLKENLINKLIEVDEYTKEKEIPYFHLGKTTLKNINKYKESKDYNEVYDIESVENGSGALLMMYPIAYNAHINKLSEQEILSKVKEVVQVTHNHEINIISCFIYTMYLIFLLRGKDKLASLSMLKYVDYSTFDEDTLMLFDNIIKNSLKDTKMDDIETNGYVVKSLEASLYVLINSNNYSQSILGAINLGGKTSITASLVGTMAGILYGIDNIPDEWIDNIKNIEVFDKYKEV